MTAQYDKLIDLTRLGVFKTKADLEYAAKSHTHSGYQTQHTTATCSLTVAGWTNNEQTVSAAGVTATNTVIVAPAPASAAAWAAAGVVCTAQAAGSLTFTCTTAPTAALTANVLILG